MTENMETRDARILIVDDNPKNLQVLGGALRSENYEVEFATSGSGAISWLDKESFDLILLDVMMPEMDGFETCSRIRDGLNLLDIPIIFLTAKTDNESILKGFKVGAQDYITKPFDSLELLARVSTHLELRFARENLKDVNKYLEKLVDERTQKLNKANKELSQLDTIKGEFLNMLSHEIRTPLNGIKGSLQLLKVRIDSEDLIQLIDILDSSVVRLEKFSYTALLITRLQSGKYKSEENVVCIKDELDFSLLPLNKELSKKKLTINVDGLDMSLTLTTDKDLLHELMKRVIDNAVKYSPDNTTVSIAASNSNGKVAIEIIDEGNGFPEKILSSNIKLFNPGEMHVNKNMGLNLYLCSLIVKTLGGEMIIGNKDEGGAIVKMQFPQK